MKRLKWIQQPLIIASIALFILITACMGLLIRPFGECLDFVSGHAPSAAREAFIQRAIGAVLQQDNAWLETTIHDPALIKRLTNAHSQISASYRIELVDELAGDYQYRLFFNNGAIVDLTLHSIWSPCPDFRLTEKEIFTKIELQSFFVR